MLVMKFHHSFVRIGEDIDWLKKENVNKTKISKFTNRKGPQKERLLTFYKMWWDKVPPNYKIIWKPNVWSSNFEVRCRVSINMRKVKEETIFNTKKKHHFHFKISDRWLESTYHKTQPDFRGSDFSYKYITALTRSSLKANRKTLTSVLQAVRP